jgi:hypothetical protein
MKDMASITGIGLMTGSLIMVVGFGEGAGVMVAEELWFSMGLVEEGILETRSILLNGRVRLDAGAEEPPGWGLGVAAVVTVFLTAPIAAVPAAVALEFRFLAPELRLAKAFGLAGAGAGAEQRWSSGNRWAGQNCCLHDVQRIGENKTFLQVGRAQSGVDFALTLPVTTEHSLSRCMSIRKLGSCPGRIETGILHSGQFGATLLNLVSSYFEHL